MNNQINLVRPGKKDGDVIAPNHNSRFVAVKSNSSTEFQPNKTREAQKNTEKDELFFDDDHIINHLFESMN